MSLPIYLLLLGALALQRLFELRLSGRNLERALARGGSEFGQGHFGVMKALHALFLVACASECLLLGRPFQALLGWPMLALALIGEGLRYWAMFTLGPAWNARVVLVPGQPVVTTGPYRYIRHPNYVGVVLVIFAVPLIHGGWITSLVFSVANAFLLRVRIRCEEAALAEHSDYGESVGVRPRFVPGRSRAAEKATGVAAR